MTTKIQIVMGHKVSRHKTYMVSRAPDQFPTRTHHEQSSQPNGDLRREEMPKTEKGPVLNGKMNHIHLNQNGHFPNNMIHNQKQFQQDSKRDENENRIPTTATNNTKKNVKLTRPVILHDPAKPVRNGVKSGKIIARKPLSARLPDQPEPKFVKQSDRIKDVMSRSNDTSSPAEQQNVPLLHVPNEHSNTDSVAVNGTNTQLINNGRERSAENDCQNQSETGVTQSSSFSTQKSAKSRQRAESIEDIPYPVIFEDDAIAKAEVVGKTQASAGPGIDDVTYPMVHSDISHDFPRGTEPTSSSDKIVNSDTIAPETCVGANVVSVYVDGQGYHEQTSTAPNDRVEENESSDHMIRISHKKTNSIPSIKGILKITSDSTPYGSVSGRRYMAQANGDLNSSTQSLQRGEPKRSSKQVTIQTPEGDKKDKKSKKREKVKRERPSSAIFFSEEVRKINKSHPTMLRQETDHVRYGSINGRPSRFVSEMSLNNIPYFEVGNPQYIIGDSRKLNKLVTQQAYNSQVPVMYDPVWGRPDMQFQGYQQVSKPNKKFFMNL